MAAIALLGSVLSACGEDAAQEPRQARPVTRAEAQTVLDARAEALLAGDRAAFLRTLDRRDADLVQRQRRYFANVTQLPWAEFSYEVLPGQWPEPLRAQAWGPRVRLAEVRLTTQLAGFDDLPVEQTTGFAFARRAGKVVVISDRTGNGRVFPGSAPPPWELVRVRVREGEHLLALFDDQTWDQADQLTPTLTRGIRQVQRTLPWWWDGRVVVYVFARAEVLDSFEGVPGGNIAHLGAMTFSVYAQPGDAEVAGIRFTLLPQSILAGEPFLSRITRHELAHVALGARDDGVPTWLAEGVAEYVGAKPLPRDERGIATEAVERAAEPVYAMPDSRDFNGPDQAWNYALSWMACDFVAARWGEARLWRLLEAMHAAAAGEDGDQEAVLEEVLGISEADLAARAARRIQVLYG